jgi:vacuolar-type H+-ATPase subunit I/STV1
VLKIHRMPTLAREVWPARSRGYDHYDDLSPTIRSSVTEWAYIQQMRGNYRIGLNLADRPKTPGFTAVGIFLFFGAVMSSLAATTLLWRGSALDVLWDLNPTAYKKLAPLGGTVGILFLLLGAALATAGIGWFQRRLWGWRLAVLIIATQVLGDVVNCVTGDLLRGGTGVIIAGALLLFLLHRKVRATFT